MTSPDAALASVDNASLHSNSHAINNLPHSIHRRRSSSPASLSPQNYSNNRQHHHQQHSILHNGKNFKLFLNYFDVIDWLILNRNIFAEIFNNYHISDGDGRDSWPSPDGSLLYYTLYPSLGSCLIFFTFIAAAPHPEINQIGNFSNPRGDNSKFVLNHIAAIEHRKKWNV